MKADKVAMRIQQQVSGIRVETLNRGYAELDELRVVFDRVDPYQLLIDKVLGLMEKHSFYNTHASDDGGKFEMVFARATSFGIEQLERMARKSRAEIRQEAKRRVTFWREEVCPTTHACRAILTALMNAGGVMPTVELVHTVVYDRSFQHDDFLTALSWLRDRNFVDTIIPNRWSMEKTQITPSGRYAIGQFFN